MIGMTVELLILAEFIPRFTCPCFDEGREGDERCRWQDATTMYSTCLMSPLLALINHDTCSWARIWSKYPCKQVSYGFFRSRQSFMSISSILSQFAASPSLADLSLKVSIRWLWPIGWTEVRDSYSITYNLMHYMKILSIFFIISY